MANESIRAAFERMWSYVKAELEKKSGKNHTHNDYAATEHAHFASEIVGGAFNGTVFASEYYESPRDSCLRNSKLVSADTDPTVNGEINWTYG